MSIGQRVDSKGMEMPGTVDSLVNAARQEWNHWGASTWNLISGDRKIGHTDDEVKYGQYIINNYCSIGGGSPTADEIADDEYFWSAVGISAIFHRAGFTKNEFPFSQAHSSWIKKFVKARKNGTPALYHGYRLTEANATPDVGDIIGYTYAKVTFEQAQAYFDKTGNFASHTDIVVARRDREVDVIGANVLDSVTVKTVPLTQSGLIADRGHKWFVVLRRQGF